MTDLRTMTAVWMGITTVDKAVNDGRLRLIGSQELRSTIQKWLGLSAFADVEKRVSV